ncbi:hypothetical protein C7401_13395 [Paraburkholderia unamae]|nr:hypothetical protein C7401_13395 [Paraburkholderia unamae]
MTLIIAMMALAFLMFAAYRGYSVILCAPVAALAAVLLTEPAAVAPVFTGIFMENCADNRASQDRALAGKALLAA